MSYFDIPHREPRDTIRCFTVTGYHAGAERSRQGDGAERSHHYENWEGGIDCRALSNVGHRVGHHGVAPRRRANPTGARRRANPTLDAPTEATIMKVGGEVSDGTPVSGTEKALPSWVPPQRRTEPSPGAGRSHDCDVSSKCIGCRVSRSISTPVTGAERTQFVPARNEADMNDRRDVLKFPRADEEFVAERLGTC